MLDLGKVRFLVSGGKLCELWVFEVELDEGVVVIVEIRWI